MIASRLSVFTYKAPLLRVDCKRNSRNPLTAYTVLYHMSHSTCCQNNSFALMNSIEQLALSVQQSGHDLVCLQLSPKICLVAAAVELEDMS